MHNKIIFFLICFLLSGILTAHSESVSVGNTVSLTIGSVNYSHINVPPAWVIHNPENLELISGQNTTTILVKGKSAGTCTVTCDYWTEKYDSDLKMWVVEGSTKTKSFTVTVNGPTSISLNTTSVSLSIGETEQLTATVYPSTASQSVTWSSSNENVATVNSSGLITAVAKGGATITAKSSVDNTIRATCDVGVLATPVAPTSISLNTTSAYLTVGETRQLSATVLPSGASQSVTWSVFSGSSVASVSSSGLVTAKAVGSATVRATSTEDNSIYKDCNISVRNPMAKLSVSASSGEIERGTQITLTATPASARIYYTLDGSNPEDNGILYTNPITITQDITLKAFAEEDNYERSSILSRTYTVVNPKLALSSNTLSGRVDVGTTITLSASNSNAIIYYTTDGSTPTTNSSVYTAPLTIEHTTDINAFAVCDDYFDSDIMTYHYTVSTVSLSISPSDRYLVADSKITLTATPSDATIYYTIDGRDPLLYGNVYSAPIVMSKSMIVRAKAKYQGYIDSEEVRQAYRLRDVSKEFQGEGTEANPYLISTAADLRKLADDVERGKTYRDQFFKMTTNVKINKSVLDDEGNLNAEHSDNFEPWKPIGTEKTHFCGTFDGDNHTISGLYIYLEESGIGGLFGYLSGTIKNLVIKDSYFGGKGEFGCVTAYAEKATINNKAYNASVSNCLNFGVIDSQSEYCGGICAVIRDCYISQCANFGHIKGASYIGGIVGDAGYAMWYGNSTIMDCCNMGIVECRSRGGGITGQIGHSKLYNSVNHSSIICSELPRAGGISGLIYKVTINGCINYGNVPSEKEVEGGAIAGLASFSNSSDSRSYLLNNAYLETSCPFFCHGGQEKLNALEIGNYRKNNKVMTMNEMKQQSFLDELNANAAKLGSTYSKWKFGSDGLPTLEWVDEMIAATTANMPLEENEDVEPTDVSFFIDALYANAVTASKGSTATLTINLKNEQTTNGYSFDLKLPEGVTLAKDNSNEYIYTLSNRHNGHAATVNYKDIAGVYGFAVMSLSSKDVKESDGAIMTLTLNIGGEMAEGDYAVKVQNAKYSLSSGATSVAMEDVTSLLTIESYIKGDANGDNSIDIADAVCIVNHIVGKATPAFIEAAADANGDGVVDIADAVRIVNLIVGKIDALARKQYLDDALPNPE